MSLNIENKLREIAKNRCRELRKIQTPSAKLLWDALRDRSFLGRKFYRQYPLFFDYLGKETFYIADFYCHEHKLIIEIDGKIHAYQKRKDELRSEIINQLGVAVIRVRSEEVLSNFQKVLIKLENKLIQPLLKKA